MRFRSENGLTKRGSAIVMGADHRLENESRRGVAMIPLMKKAFDHIGIITLEPQAGEAWVPDSQVWVTNPRKHPNRIEYVRPKEMPNVPPDQAGLWKLWHWPHVAYRVENLRVALAGKEIVLGPF